MYIYLLTYIRVLQEYLAHILVVVVLPLDVAVQEKKLLQVAHLVAIQITGIESVNHVHLSSVHDQSVLVQHLRHELIEIYYPSLVDGVWFLHLLDILLELHVLLLSLP